VFTPWVPSAYPAFGLGGWSASIVGMLVGLVLTVVVSWATAPASAENRDVYFEGLTAE